MENKRIHVIDNSAGIVNHMDPSRSNSMKRPAAKHGMVILGALTGYILGYACLVRPDVGYEPYEYRYSLGDSYDATYRWGGEFCYALFTPVHWLDVKVRPKEWKCTLDGVSAWRWHPERESLLWYYVHSRVAEYGVRMTFGPRPLDHATLTFTDGDATVWTHAAHPWSAFVCGRAAHLDRAPFVIFADFSPLASGCTLIAYDLSNGKQLWRNDLRGLGPVVHSIYSNRINLDWVTKRHVAVFGKEICGEYVEVVDVQNGKSVYHRLVSIDPGMREWWKEFEQAESTVPSEAAPSAPPDGDKKKDDQED